MIDDTNDFESFMDRMPPQNLDAEAAILGGLMLDPPAFTLVRDKLKPHHFYLPAHGRIYGAIVALNAKEIPADLMIVINYLKENKWLDTVGGRGKLINLIQQTVSSVNLDALAELVIEKWQRRQLGAIARRATELQHKSDEQVSIQEAVEELQKMLTDLQLDQSSDGGITHISETLIGVYEEVEKRSQGLVSPGIPCGFFDLDSMTSGFQRSDLIIAAGRPSMGKTAFCLNVANYVAASARLPVAVFSLEMAKQQLGQRLLASEAGIENGLLRSGRVGQGQWEPLSRAISNLSDIPLYLDSTPNPSPQYIESQCRRVIAQEKQLGLVIIDYLQLMEGGNGFGNRNIEISTLCRGLKVLAMKLQVPVICLSQLSRGVETRTNKRPMLSDLRDSGSIEQDADIVLMLYRDEYYNIDTTERGVAEVIVAKHRNGQTGTVKLLFDNQLTKFKNLIR